jgi:hypothetical protein
MVAINTIIDDVLNELSANITELKVEAFPENPSNYRLIHPKGAILVSYVGSNFRDMQGFELVQQIESLDISLTLIIKGLRDKDGAYTYIDEIKEVLTGYSPTGCTMMFPLKIDFIGQTNGEWQYLLDFRTTKENVN